MSRCCLTGDISVYNATKLNVVMALLLLVFLIHCVSKMPLANSRPLNKRILKLTLTLSLEITSEIKVQ